MILNKLNLDIMFCGAFLNFSCESSVHEHEVLANDKKETKAGAAPDASKRCGDAYDGDGDKSDVATVASLM